EIFTASALMMVIAIALLMELVGLSPALGTFLAGVVLANSEYRHELESDIEPFKGLLLGLFFITVGAGINLALLSDQFALIAILTLSVIALKFGVLYVIAIITKLPKPAGLLMAIGLCQVGEFGFVLINFSTQNNALPSDLASLLSLVVAISMLITPFLFIIYDKFISGRIQGDEKQADTIDDTGKVIIAGHGRFGQVINRILLSSGIKTVVLDHKSTLVEGMRRFGIKTFFGDASRPDLLHSAGLGEAKLLIIAIDDPERAIEMVKFARRERSDIHIIARALDRHHVYELYSAGANDIVRETFDSAVRAGKYSLLALGEKQQEAEKTIEVYVQHDRENLVKLARVWKPGMDIANSEEYKSVAKENQALLLAAIQALKKGDNT
ncbi:MAG: cation:proton antiporter, partial [Emcibacteraceae bacterium]|nr:cation:proton antiporter [Emcibacteraceae bacterium]